MNPRPNRREALVGASAAVAALVLGDKWGRAADDKPQPKTRFLATGGSLFNNAQFPLLRYAVSLAGKEDPVVCLLPTASGDEANLIVKWYDLAADLPCRPRHVKTFDVSPRTPAFEKRLLSADVILVSGGNTLNMVAVWKAQEIDTVLRKAWEAGTLVVGDSAGMIAWFEEGMSDSWPGKHSRVEGLGFLLGSAWRP